MEGVGMFCTKCGNKIADDAKFCTSCGSQVILFSNADINNTNSVLPLNSNSTLEFGKFLDNKTSVTIDKNNLILKQHDGQNEQNVTIPKGELFCATKSRVYNYSSIIAIAVCILLIVFMPNWLVTFIMRIFAFFFHCVGIEIGMGAYGTFKLVIIISLLLDIISNLIQFCFDKIEIKTKSNQSYDIRVSIFDSKRNAEELLLICNQKGV